MSIKLNISLQHYHKAGDLASFIKNHVADKEALSLEALSLRFGICQTLLSRGFKYRYQKTIHNYIIEARINKAKEMLLDKRMKIKNISDELGYPEISHFTRDFKKVLGVPPNQYRREFRYNHEPENLYVENAKIASLY